MKINVLATAGVRASGVVGLADDGAWVVAWVIAQAAPKVAGGEIASRR